MYEKDFFEGVKCLLIERKGTPKWEYKSVSEVPEEVVQKYFARLPENLELNIPSIYK